jgi:hypothetical protein
VEYTAEARLGEELTLRWAREGENCYLEGGGERPCFRMELAYRE